MAVVPVCYKMSFKNQSLLHLKEIGKVEKGFTCSFIPIQEDSVSFPSTTTIGTGKRCLHYATCYSSKANTRRGPQCHLRSSSGNAPQREKWCLACDAYKSDSLEKQLQSLDAYFEKVQQDANEPTSVSSNKNEEFIDQGDQFKAKRVLGSLEMENYLGKVNKDGNSINYASSAFDDTSEEKIYIRGGSGKGGWKKLKNYVRIKDEDRSKQFGILVSINIAVFLFEMASPVRNSDLELFSLPLIYGAKINHLILLGEWWRLITPMFLHSGIFHICLGCWVLLSFGPQVCKAYGSFTFLLIFILGGIAGNLTSFLLTPEPAVGGTGPVFAIIGAWLIYQFQNKDVIPKTVSDDMFRKAISATVISFILSNFSLIDDWTHFGAALTGIAYGFLTCPILQMDDGFPKSGQQKGIRLVKQYADPCKSLMIFSLFAVILSSLLFIVDPPTLWDWELTAS